jgi:RND family efflux transporter MFP subunit
VLKRILWLAIAVTIVIGAGVAWSRYPVASVPGDVDAIRVVRRNVRTEVKATGVIRPMTGAQVRVGARISGIVRRLAVRVGDRVSAGQLLAELDDRELIARRRQAEAARNLARANLAFAVADVQRKRELATVELLARSDLDVAERAASVAAQELAQAEAALDFANTQLAYARVDAPIAGVVASVSTQEGETVAASFAAPTFVTLLDLKRLEVWAYVDETDIGRIHVGQRARFTVDTFGAEEFEGDVRQIYPQPEIRDNVVDYVAVVRFGPEETERLRPEMTTSVRIATDERLGVLTVPPRFVQHDGSGAYVWRRRGTGVDRVPVTLGIRNERDWEITSGLTQQDEVLSRNPAAPEGDTQ